MASSLAILLSLSTMLQPVQAEEVALPTSAPTAQVEVPVSVIGNNFVTIGSGLSSGFSSSSIYDAYDQALTPINQTITDKGISIKLNGIGFDGKTFIVSYEVTVDDQILGEQTEENHASVYISPTVDYTENLEDKYQGLPEIQQAMQQYSNNEITKGEIHQKLLEYSWKSQSSLPLFMASSSSMGEVEGNTYKGISNFYFRDYPDGLNMESTRDANKKLSIIFNTVEISKWQDPTQELEEGFSFPEHVRQQLTQEKAENNTDSEKTLALVMARKTVTGNWQFDTDLSENDILVPMEHVQLADSKYDKDGEMIQIEEIYKSPFGNRLIISGNMLVPQNVAGNQGMSYSTTSFYVVDQNGKSVIKQPDSSSWGGWDSSGNSVGMKFTSKFILGNMDEAEVLTVIPYIQNYSTIEMKQLNDRKYYDVSLENLNTPFEVNHTEYTISNFEKTDEKISFNVSAKGYAGSEQNFRELCLRDDKGNLLFLDYTLSKWDENSNSGYIEFVNSKGKGEELPSGMFGNVSEAVAVSIPIQDIEILEKYIFDVQIVK